MFVVAQTDSIAESMHYDSPFASSVAAVSYSHFQASLSPAVVRGTGLDATSANRARAWLVDTAAFVREKEVELAAPYYPNAMYVASRRIVSHRVVVSSTAAGQLSNVGAVDATTYCALLTGPAGTHPWTISCCTPWPATSSRVCLWKWALDTARYGVVHLIVA
jgi:hypothetical protein